MPHDDGIYIFGSNGLADITFFLGSDLLPTDVKAKLIKLIKKERVDLKNKGLDITSTFSLYLREMYTQIAGSLNDPNRAIFEQSVIDLLKNSIEHD